MKRPIDTKLHIAVKVIMTAIFLWSGFFWSGVTIMQFYINNTEHANLATEFLIGSLILLAALILAWARYYILQFIAAAVGLSIYLVPTREMIDQAAHTGVLFKPTFEQRYLPIIGFAILSLVLVILRVWGLVAAAQAKREEYDNRPAESILEKRHDN